MHAHSIKIRGNSSHIILNERQKPSISVEVQEKQNDTSNRRKNHSGIMKQSFSSIIQTAAFVSSAVLAMAVMSATATSSRLLQETTTTTTTTASATIDSNSSNNLQQQQDGNDGDNDSGCYRARLAFDDFEHGLDKRWECAEIASHPTFGNFGTNPIDQDTLPPATLEDFLRDGGGCDLSRTFEIDPVAQDVRLEFLSYAWCTCGDMELSLCNTTIDIDRNMNRGSPGGSRNGIVWTRHNVSMDAGGKDSLNADASDHPDRVQWIKLEVPPRCYTGTGDLQVKFIFRNIGGVDNHIGAVDNVTLSAEICAPTSVPAYQTFAPTRAPTPVNACIVDVDDHDDKNGTEVAGAKEDDVGIENSHPNEECKSSGFPLLRTH